MFLRALFAFCTAASCIAAPLKIEVRESGTGWPVPLVELRTTHGMRFFTDNAGVVAFEVPEFAGEAVWLEVRADGYEAAADGFGFRGVRIEASRKEPVQVEVRRTIVAKRLGRLTGAGLFAESQKFGEHLDATESGVVGCDSIQSVIHRGKKVWMWGDTTLRDRALGLFHMTGAVTPLAPLPRFEPPVAMPYTFFRDAKGRPRSVAEMPGTGPTWLLGYASLADATGVSRLVATYTKITPPLEESEVGLCIWNDDTSTFERHLVLWKKADAPGKAAPPAPRGHSVRWTDAHGAQWLLFGDPFPALKCPASFEAWSNPQTWEAIEPQKKLEGLLDGKRVSVIPHRGSIAWSPFRKRWITIFEEHMGKPSVFGEVWYAESDSPLGPWGTAVKILSHTKHTFYNVRIHEDLTPSGSAIVLFEGTYTRDFSNHAEATPRYDYNQILYRLDLDDNALVPAHTKPQYGEGK